MEVMLNNYKLFMFGVGLSLLIYWVFKRNSDDFTDWKKLAMNSVFMMSPYLVGLISFQNKIWLIIAMYSIFFAVLGFTTTVIWFVQRLFNNTNQDASK